MPRCSLSQTLMHACAHILMIITETKRQPGRQKVDAETPENRIVGNVVQKSTH